MAYNKEAARKLRDQRIKEQHAKHALLMRALYDPTNTQKQIDYLNRSATYKEA